MFRKRKKHSFIISLLALALIAAVVFSIISGQSRIVSETYELYFENLPASFDGVRIAHISDLHGRSFGEGNAELLEKTAALRPDLIVMTGDMVDDPGQLETMETLFTGLLDIAPTIAKIMGLFPDPEWEGRALCNR